MPNLAVDVLSAVNLLAVEPLLVPSLLTALLLTRSFNLLIFKKIVEFSTDCEYLE